MSHPNSRDFIDRFMGKFVVDDESGCWVWMARLDRGGYGGFSLDRRYVIAHRVSYEIFKGPIPEGLALDHLCRNRGCVNPDHLEPVTNKVNAERGLHAKKTACPQGHPYDAENTRLYRGRRYCKACCLAQAKESKRRKREEKQAA